MRVGLLHFDSDLENAVDESMDAAGKQTQLSGSVTGANVSLCAVGGSASRRKGELARGSGSIRHRGDQTSVSGRDEAT